jgi:uncharacterized damage-inducible protein DinB
MARTRIVTFCACSLALVAPLAALAQGGSAAPAAAAPAAAAAAPATGFQADLLKDYSGAIRHLTQLAEAVPAEKYSWRPAEGVRSFSQVFMHVAAGNYMGAKSLGLPVPAGVDPTKLETITDKAQVIAALRASVEHFQKAAAAVDDAGLEQQVDLFGMKLGKRRVMLLMQGHAHEHTGQAIAYARMNGIVPPWSQPAAAAGGSGGGGR